jgi:hypothetical protein
MQRAFVVRCLALTVTLLTDSSRVSTNTPLMATCSSTRHANSHASSHCQQLNLVSIQNCEDRTTHMCKHAAQNAKCPGCCPGCGHCFSAAAAATVAAAASANARICSTDLQVHYTMSSTAMVKYSMQYNAAHCTAHLACPSAGCCIPRPSHRPLQLKLPQNLHQQPQRVKP